ncbi:MAG: TetR/AcrR family transcriptional regulator [Robiginitomaculum sp.]|nr:TetR/AcrR family transcriptional regulator [Robiginitomaculum sp.]
MEKTYQPPKKSTARRSNRIRGNDATRRKIFKAAKIVLTRDGAQKTTIRKIAKQAGVSAGLINQYYGTKIELILEIFKAGNKPLHEYFRTHLDQFKTPTDLALGAMEVYLTREMQDPELARQVMASSWLWGPEDEGKFSSSLEELISIVSTALQEKFYPGQEFLTVTATYTLSSIFVGVLRMGLQRDWPTETYLSVMRPSFVMLMSGLDEQVRQNLIKDNSD